ncbi:MAG TPA: hypothetical protein VF228_16390 [Iamia sp.]
MRNRLVALTGACGLLLVLASGCTVTSPPEHGVVRNKARTGSGALDYELVLRGPDGVDRDVRVSRSQYNRARRGDCWSRAEKQAVDAARCES